MVGDGSSHRGVDKVADRPHFSYRLFEATRSHCAQPNPPEVVLPQLDPNEDSNTVNPFLEKIKQGMARTRKAMSGRIAAVVPAAGHLDEDAVDEIEALLIAADVGLDTAVEIIDEVRARRDKIVRPEDLTELLKAEVSRVFAPDPPFSFSAPPAGSPCVILVVGVNGTGKTTTAGKLAKRYVGAGRKVLLAACDTFRAAAISQLEVWAERAGADMVRPRQGADPGAVAFDALAAARARKMDVLIVDTAGRLHNKVNLMEELKKIRRSLNKQDQAAPHETLLVLDATTGQNILSQAREFDRATGLSGFVLTKLDGTAKGGIAIALRRELQIPVKLVGVGEGSDDLHPFNGETFAQALFE